ncbi:MAG: hypothetical protein IKN65_08115 [Clostridia bacterium]|nr:hypothetical protein [Clostridia bacterium]
MEQFDSLEKVKNYFRQATGEENNDACYLVALVDTSSDAAIIGGILGGAVGGAIGGMVAGMQQQYDGYLLMQTNDGFGLIPLIRDGIAWVNPYAKLQVHPEKYFFVNNSDIKEFKIQKVNMGTGRRITIELNNKQKIRVVANKRDKHLPFLKECIEKICERNNCK